jgi:hypothetical protein
MDTRGGHEHFCQAGDSTRIGRARRGACVTRVGAHAERSCRLLATLAACTPALSLVPRSSNKISCREASDWLIL